MDNEIIHFSWTFELVRILVPPYSSCIPCLIVVFGVTWDKNLEPSIW